MAKLYLRRSLITASGSRTAQTRAYGATSTPLSRAARGAPPARGEAARGRTFADTAARAGVGLTAVVCSLASAGALVRALGSLIAHAEIWRIDDVVGAAILVVGTAISTWYAVTGFGLLAAAAAQRSLGVESWGAPLLRRIAIGLVVSAGVAAPATAHSIPHDMLAATSLTDPTPLPNPLVGLDEAAGSMEEEDPPQVPPTQPPVDPEQTERASASPSALPEPPVEHPADTGGAHEHIVSPGECLWSISAAHLGPDASDVEIVELVTETIADNPETQSNPHLILPGQVITIPEVSS